MYRVFCILTIIMMIGGPVTTADPRAITPEDLWALKRIGDAELSPDAKFIAYELTTYDMEQNSGRQEVHIIETATAKLRSLPDTLGELSQPHWIPTSGLLTFLGEEGDSCIVYQWESRTGNVTSLMKLPVTPDDYKWSPDGNWMAFIAPLYQGCETLEASVQRAKEIQTSKVRAKIADQLPYRLWNRWITDSYSHLFLTPHPLSRYQTGPRFRDISPGAINTPPLDLDSGDDFCFSPGSRELTFIANSDSSIAVSTNNDLFAVTIPLAGEKVFNPRPITRNRAVDNNPQYSPDGKWLAWRAMTRPGFEADQYDIVLQNRKNGAERNLTLSFDQDVDNLFWNAKSQAICFTSLKHGQVGIYRINIQNLKIDTLFNSHINSLIGFNAQEEIFYVKHQRSNYPSEIHAIHVKTRENQPLTQVNAELLKQLAMNPIEDFYFTSFDGQRVHGYLLKPPFFDPQKKYPLVYLIHGGPQGSWEDEFHYRWNYQMFASRGYVVAMVDPRGSKGYGQKFCDAVSQDWGGGPFRDLILGLDSVIARCPFIEGERVAAAGASYGGYMINWIAVHPEAKKFKALVSHAGVYNLISKYGATEELWFPEWEFGGTPYENDSLYKLWSPSSYAAELTRYRVPTLVVHGEQDYRVPVGQGLEFFTALQRQSIPSRLLYFPDEYHFVVKPLNAQLWWNTVLDWMDHWTK